MQEEVYGAQSETECRRLIIDFSLMLINRQAYLKQKSTDTVNRQIELKSEATMRDRPHLSVKSQRLAAKQRRRRLSARDVPTPS